MFQYNFYHKKSKRRQTIDISAEKVKNEIKKLKVTVPIYAYHLKTQFEEEIKQELTTLLPQVKVLNEKETLNF